MNTTAHCFHPFYKIVSNQINPMTLIIIISENYLQLNQNRK